MHIVIDAHLAVKEIDGVSRYLNGLLAELPKIDLAVQYTILSLPRQKSGLPEELFSYPNVTRFELDLMGPSPKQHFILPGLLKDLKADVYHHPQFDLPLRVKVPSVVTIHDLKYITHPEFLSKKNRLKSIYIKKSLQRSLRVANKVIAVSQNTLNDLKTLFSFDPKKGTVIYHGVNSAAFNSRPNNGHFNMPSAFVLFVGTRRPHKNLEGLIKALALLHKDYHTNLDLVISGKAYSDYTKPEMLAKELNIDSHVHFLDFVPDDELPTLYKSAKVVALPSFYEGFGLPLLESMAYGTPVIGSNVSSIPEVIGDAGLLVNPLDPGDIAAKIHQIISNTELYKKLSHAGLARQKQFSWSSAAKSTFKVYVSMLESQDK